MKTANITHIFFQVKDLGKLGNVVAKISYFFPIHVCPPKKTLLGKQNFKKCFPTKSETYFYYFIPVWHTLEKTSGYCSLSSSLKFAQVSIMASCHSLHAWLSCRKDKLISCTDTMGQGLHKHTS